MTEREHMSDDARQLKVGVLGCGPIAQAAHFESATKAKNAELYAICDVADDLRERMAATHAPRKTFPDYDEMLADPELDAVIIATSDAFHVAGRDLPRSRPASTCFAKSRSGLGRGSRGAEAGRGGDRPGPAGRPHEALRRRPAERQGPSSTTRWARCWPSRPGIAIPRIATPMTDAVQPLIVKSASARKPAGDPKADLERYYMLAHGSHLLDTARYLGGEIVEVEARLATASAPTAGSSMSSSPTARSAISI